MLSLVCIIFALFFAYGKLLDFATAYPIGVGKPNGSVTLNRRVDLRLGYRRHRQALGDAARGVEIEGNAAAAVPSAAHELKAIGRIGHDRIDAIRRQRGQHLAAIVTVIASRSTKK
jgi:hypothetical protein